jgi:hypothetical protein
MIVLSPTVLGSCLKLVVIVTNITPKRDKSSCGVGVFELKSFLNDGVLVYTL